MPDHKETISCHCPVKGSGFTLECPTSDAPAKSISPRPHLTPQLPLANPTTAPARILVVDDERALAEMLRQFLIRLGYKVTVCNSVSNALQVMEKQSFDIILSDYRMPVMDGRQFYQEIFSKDPDSAKRMILMTGDIDNDQTSEFLKETGNSHLEKPFNLTSLKQLLDAKLKHFAALIPSPAQPQASNEVAVDSANGGRPTPLNSDRPGTFLVPIRHQPNN